MGHNVKYKLSPKFVGSCKVCKVNDNKVNYEIPMLNSSTLIKVHHSQLRLWHSPPRYLRSYYDLNSSERPTLEIPCRSKPSYRNAACLAESSDSRDPNSEETSSVSSSGQNSDGSHTNDQDSEDLCAGRIERLEVRDQQEISEPEPVIHVDHAK